MSKDRQRFDVPNVPTVRRIDWTHESHLRPVIPPRLGFVGCAVHRQVCAAKVRDHSHIRHATQLLGDSVTATPRTLEGLQKLVQHPIRPPEEPQCFGLQHIDKVGPRVVGTLELVHLLVEFKQHVLGRIAEHTPEFTEAQVTRRFQTLELEMVAVGRRLDTQQHVKRPTQHHAKLIGLSTEQSTRVLGPLYMRKQHLVKNADNLHTAARVRLLLKDFHVCLLCPLQEGLVAKDERREDIVIHDSLRFKHTEERDLVDIAVRRTSQCTKHADQRNRLSKPRYRNGRDSFVLAVIRRPTCLGVFIIRVPVRNH